MDRDPDAAAGGAGTMNLLLGASPDRYATKALSPALRLRVVMAGYSATAYCDLPAALGLPADKLEILTRETDDIATGYIRGWTLRLATGRAREDARDAVRLFLGCPKAHGMLLAFETATSQEISAAQGGDFAMMG
jgi:hypothetical protein